MLGVVMTSDGNIVELGKAIEKRRRQDPGRAAATASSSSASPTSRRWSSDAVWEFERSLHGGARPSCSSSASSSLGWRTGIVVGLVGAAGARRGRSSSCSRWAGTCDRISLGSLIIALGLLVDDAHHRGRDDGGEDGAGLGPAQGGRLLLLGDRVAAADRRAGHRRRLHADRLRQVDDRRICRRHLLDRRHRGAVLLDRVAGSSRPTSRSSMLPKDFGKHHHGARSVRHAVLPQAARL